MGVPPPCMTVAPGTGAPSRSTTKPETSNVGVSGPPDADGVVTVRLDAPTWNRLREPAEQGIAVERMTVTPVSVPVPVR